jgi:hypothetical protein
MEDKNYERKARAASTSALGRCCKLEKMRVNSFVEGIAEKPKECTYMPFHQ